MRDNTNFPDAVDDIISRQEAIDSLAEWHDEAITNRLNNLSPIDAVPIVHGEWVWVQYDANPEIGNFHCSKCNFIPAAFNMVKQHLNYCPNCGAKMDGE